VPTLHPATAALSFARTVPPALVNRRSAGEVFVTDAGRLAPDEFVVAARLRRRHALWSDQRAPWHDPLATVEAFRQAFVLVRNRYLQVPAGTPSGVQHLEFSVDDLDAYRDDGVAPFDSVLRLRVTPAASGEGALDISGTCTTSSVRALTFSARSLLIPCATYDEIRAFQRSRRAAQSSGPDAGRPAEPAAVGRRDPRNVVVGRPVRRPDRYPLVVDRAHPSFFDKDYDHIPGTLLLEAVRQSAQLAAAGAGLLPGTGTVTRARLEFTTFAELDAPAECGVTVARGPAPRLVAAAVDVHQFGERIAGGHLEVTGHG